ncbi:MAG TPA: PhzF family phenazine biosynthesis protein [Sphingomicrobium sp.]|nr:PhzF family phenazine biosynthesis protein [Sphingomicrobium sp.]
MTALPFFQVDAFAEEPLTGNPAAVMPLEHWLEDGLMQAIAAENNLSETAFLVPSDRADADYDLRWFTPATEVELCGHATLASAHALITGERIRFATRSGVLTVASEDGLLKLDLPAFDVQPGDAPGLLEALGVEGEILVGEGGNNSAIVLLPDEAAVRSVRPDFAALKAFDRLVIVTAPGDEQDVASRVFASYHGIDEDPVTGSAHAALVPYWAKKLGRDTFTAFQASARGGLLHCQMAGDRVILGGKCVTVIEGYFQL